jgi:hypothetical protein
VPVARDVAPAPDVSPSPDASPSLDVSPASAPAGLAGYRFLLAVLLLFGLSATPVVVVVAAGQAALEPSAPPVAPEATVPWATVPETTATPGRAGSGGTVLVSRADPAVPAPC